MDFSLSPDEQAVLNDARYAAPAIAGRATAADREARFPTEDLADLKAANLHALAVPKEFGGRGANTISYVLACEVIATADASLAIAWVMHTACGWEIAHAATTDTRAAVLNDVLENGAFICIAGSEGRLPDGTPAPLTVAPADGGWTLNGRKGFASGSDAATYVLTGAKDADGQHHSFILRMDTPGLTIADPWDGMGMRASASNGLAFDNLFAPEPLHLTGSYKTGDFRSTSTLFGLGLAATALGISQAAIDFTLAWNRTRPLPETSRNRLGDILIRADAARALLHRAAWMADCDPEAADLWVDRAKTLNVETAQQITVEAMRICGGNAFRQRYALERHVRDADALLLQGQRPDQLRIALADATLAGSEKDDCHHPARSR